MKGMDYFCIAAGQKRVSMNGADTVFIGEIGLSSELRVVCQMPARHREAATLSFKRAIVPRRARKGEPYPENIELIEPRSRCGSLNLAFVQGGR